MHSRRTFVFLFFLLLFQVPHCAFRVVNFHVSLSDGLFLCQWAREWHLAHQFECLPLNIALKETVKEAEHWFEKIHVAAGKYNYHEH